MSAQHTALFTKTITADGPLSAHHFVSESYRLPTAVGERCIGVAMADAAAGERCPVVLVGSAPIVLGADASAGQVMTDAQGRAIPLVTAATNRAAGRLVMDQGVLATAGQVREVLVRPDES